MNTIFRLSMMVSALTLIPEPPLSAGKLVWPLKPGNHAYTVRLVCQPSVFIGAICACAASGVATSVAAASAAATAPAGWNLFLVVCDMQPVSLD